MSSYAITCCSTADLTREYFEVNNVGYGTFSYYLDGVEHEDDFYSRISPHDFFQMISDGAEPTTSQLSPEKYLKLWEPYLKRGQDVLHLTLSSGISGTYQSARIAASDAKEHYSDRKVIVLDSLAASSGYGLLVDRVKENRENGMSIEDNAKWIEENKNTLHHWFFSTDLTSYIRGGRVSKVSGFFGTMLNICPLLKVNNEGKLIPTQKIRGKKKAITASLEMMKKHVKDGLAYSDKVFISHSDSEEDARALAALVEENFKNIRGKVEVYNIGTVIGSHTGPGTVALFFWGDERTA